MKVNLRPRILSWLWDVKQIWGHWCDWCDEFVEPSFGLLEAYVPYPEASKHLFYCRLSPEGVEPIEIRSLPDDLKYKRSRILPWLKYAYVTISQPRSDYSVMYASPGLIGADNKELTAEEACRVFCDTVNRAYLTTEPWWVEPR